MAGVKGHWISCIWYVSSHANQQPHVTLISSCVLTPNGILVQHNYCHCDALPFNDVSNCMLSLCLQGSFPAVVLIFQGEKVKGSAVFPVGWDAIFCKLIFIHIHIRAVPGLGALDIPRGNA